MDKLTCEICGGRLVMIEKGVVVCDCCSTEYSTEYLKNKIQEINGTVKVDGAVETVTGEAEKERLLKNAQTNIKLKEYDKAKEIYQKVIDEYPDDFRGWWGYCVILLEYFDFPNYSDSEKRLSHALDLCDDDTIKDYFFNITQNYKGLRFEKSQFSETFNSKLIRTEFTTVNETLHWFIENRSIFDHRRKYIFFYEYLDRLKNDYISFVWNGTILPRSGFIGDDNGIIPTTVNSDAAVKILSKLGCSMSSINKKLGLIGDIRNKRYKFYGRWFVFDGGRIMNLPNTATYQIIFSCSGRCQHCGGSFKGVFNKVCSICSKPKDY